MKDYNNVSTQKILSITELNRLARNVLEQSIPLLWVTGEVSNFTRAASGHWYFSLKDTQAQVRCVMFKGRNSYLDFTPREGDTIEARALIGLYEARGDYQLTIEFMQQAGLGRLFEAFEKLKQQLQLEGLFEPVSKLAIPEYPRSIGIVTSPDAAALRDVLSALKRRNPNVTIIIYPTPVQGEGSAQRIANAILSASNRAEVDTLIICRGGGSIEDLWSFNEEVVARALFACSIPTISGVGHETDFTITDFVADLRAATPTAAAELACPDQKHLLQQSLQLQYRLHKAMHAYLQKQAQTIDYFAKRLISPQQLLIQQKQLLMGLQKRLRLSMANRLKHDAIRLLSLKHSLQQLNPHAILARGYAIVRNTQGEIVRQARPELIETEISLQLAEGSLSALVKRSQPN